LRRCWLKTLASRISKVSSPLAGLIAVFPGALSAFSYILKMTLEGACPEQTCIDVEPQLVVDIKSIATRWSQPLMQSAFSRLVCCPQKAMAHRTGFRRSKTDTAVPRIGSVRASWKSAAGCQLWDMCPLDNSGRGCLLSYSHRKTREYN
jgi:hypothetical protein